MVRNRIRIVLGLSLLPLWTGVAAESKQQRIHLPDTVTLEEQQGHIQLNVIDSFLELHSGPGRGYPITHTLEQDEAVYVHRRRGNWYYVSDRRLRAGWIRQDKLARTIAPSGLPAALPDINHGDFLKQQARVGFAIGQQESSETASVMAGFRLASFAGIELEYGQIFSEAADGRTYGASLLLEPIQSWSFTPFISAGIGQQSLELKGVRSVGSSSETTLNDNYRFVGAGINYYLGLNFVVRGEYRELSLSGDSESSTSNSAWRIGFSSFF